MNPPYDPVAQLASIGLGRLARFLDCECTLVTKRGRYAIFKPRSCLYVQNGQLCVGHPCGTPLRFSRSEILLISSGVPILPYRPDELFQRIVDA